MRIEKQSNISVEYGNGIGRIEFKPSQFCFSSLREIARLQMSSTDHPFIELTHRGGRTTTIGEENFLRARELRGKELKSFTTNLAHQLERADKVSIIREVKAAPYHLFLSGDPISEFVRNHLEGLDAL